MSELLQSVYTDSKLLKKSPRANTELKMETAVCIYGFLLQVCTAGGLLFPDLEHVFGPEGKPVQMISEHSIEEGYWVLYRVFADGDLLLANCSQPDGPQPDGYEVRCLKSGGLALTNAATSHSGDYRAEVWRGDAIIDRHRRIRLTICVEGINEGSVAVHDDKALLCRLGSDLGKGSSLKLYRYHVWSKNRTLVLDTNSSLEPLEEDLKGRLKVDLNSEVSLCGVTYIDHGFYCTIWRGAQCHSYRHKILATHPEEIFAYEDESLTLPCVFKGALPGQMSWSTPTGSVRLSDNNTSPQRVMHMLNGSMTGDYSLIVPSPSKHNAGSYQCGGQYRLKQYDLYVCSKSPALEKMFSEGDRVQLKCDFNALNLTRFDGLKWYREKVLGPRVKISDRLLREELVPKDLRGRVATSWHFEGSLFISNLTAEDSGLYTCKVFGESQDTYWVCFDRSTRLVYRDPFGVHSFFYRAHVALIGCGLLGLVTAVIWVKLRSRREEQTSGCQSREGGQHGGDEDLDNKVKLAEDSV